MVKTLSNMSLRVAILTGGTSAEREVARKSAAHVAESLEGRCDLSIFNFPLQIDDFLAARASIDVAVPVFHGRGGEDGAAQGFLETLGVPYVFSGIKAHAIGMDKVQSKELMNARGYTVAKGVTLGPDDMYVFTHPIVIKPIDGGSSLGTALVRAADDLQDALVAARAQSDRVLAEDLIKGREFTVVVVEDGEALPVIEIKSKNDFFDYQSKYDAHLVEEICPAQIDDALATQLQVMAVAAHTAIGARHLSRTDMIVDALGDIYFLEINTIPGLTSVSLAPKAFAAAQLDMGDLLMGWINDVL